MVILLNGCSYSDTIFRQERQNQQFKQQKEKQEQRKQNIREHIQKKKENKMARLVCEHFTLLHAHNAQEGKKPNRAGFEGKKKEYLNKD